MVEIPQEEVTPEAVEVIYRAFLRKKPELNEDKLEVEFTSRFPQVVDMPGISAKDLGVANEMAALGRGEALDQPVLTRVVGVTLGYLARYGINSDELVDFLKVRLNPSSDPQ